MAFHLFLSSLGVLFFSFRFSLPIPESLDTCCKHYQNISLNLSHSRNLSGSNGLPRPSSDPNHQGCKICSWENHSDRPIVANVKVYGGDNDMSGWNGVGKARQAIDKQQSKAEHK